MREMEKIEMFSDFNLLSLERKVNGFLGEIENEYFVKNIRYSTSYDSLHQETDHSVLIHYKKRSE